MHRIFEQTVDPIYNKNATNFYVMEVNTLTTAKKAVNLLEEFKRNFNRELNACVIKEAKFKYGQNINSPKKKTKKITILTMPMYPSPVTFDFWAIVASLQWRDKSDGLMDSADKINKITEHCAVPLFAMHLSSKITELRTVFRNHPVLQLKRETQTEFFTHIILKGRDFYNAVLADPEFASYLLDAQEFQPLLLD